MESIQFGLLKMAKVAGSEKKEICRICLFGGHFEEVSYMNCSRVSLRCFSQLN